jgi:hypothetical protein
MTADLDEWRYEVDAMTDAEREDACGHTVRSRSGVCYECGDEAEL